MDYFVWVARNAERTVLIDCGFNEHSGARRNRTMLSPAWAAAAEDLPPTADHTEIVRWLAARVDRSRES